MTEIPAVLSSKVERHLADFRARADINKLALLEAADIAASLAKVWAVSGFVVESCLRNPELLFSLLESGDLLTDTGAAYYRQRLAEDLLTINDETELHRLLRRMRQREMLRIAWRDLAGWAELDETLADLSALAECCLGAALEFLYGAACNRWGVPLDSQGRAQNLIVLGMGKLGGAELNFSSDIDLIFAYAEAGEFPGSRGISYQEFFTKLAQGLVKALDTQTEDGFVFRVDTRLRPFGDSGPLVMHFDAMETYYQSQAREWERYAMIKARPVAGDLLAGAALMRMLQPFVYRRYLDYRAFGELREMKSKIAQELQRKDAGDSVKLGRGGIREIEFIGQAFQLLRGGQDKALQDRRIRPILAVLAERNYLPTKEVALLQAAYRYLRLTENHIQQLADQQTHDLPKDDESRLRLAFSMDHASWESFKAELEQVRDQVQAIFEQVIASTRDENDQDEARQVWLDGGSDQHKAAILAALGYSEPEPILALLSGFRRSSAVARLSARGVTELDRLLPALIRSIAALQQPATAFKRILALLEAVATRNVYYTLLAENPNALTQLVKLADASPWIASLLAQQPILLDGLLDARQLYAPQKKDDLRKELAQLLDALAEDDQEGFMIRLRHFKQAQVLRVAAADVMEVIPLMVVSDYLTDIAEVIINAALDEAWRQTVRKHGVPPGRQADRVDGFVVIAYGKLGGIELSYSSDLDLVFLFDAEHPEAATDGARPISTTQFYARIVQRLVHTLTSNMLAGVLYDVDLRLRPSGNSGLLVTSLNAFATYQADNAWTWEQQALVRARCVAGDDHLAEKFRAIRALSLSRSRDRTALQAEVRDMREKMRTSLAAKEAGIFDLKQGHGGIADIEFIVQFGTLAHAAQHPALLQWTDNVRLLEQLSAAGFIAMEDADALKQAYLHFRAQVHRAALQEQEARIAAESQVAMRDQVQAIWHKLME